MTGLAIDQTPHGFSDGPAFELPSGDAREEGGEEEVVPGCQMM